MSKVQYNINLELNQNKLIIKINDLDSSWMIRGYYLYKDGLLSKKVVKDNLEDNYEFTLENDGLYFVKVFVKKDEEMVSKNSLVVSYFKDETTNEFEKFLQEKDNSFKRIKLFNAKKPFEGFAFIMSKTKINKWQIIKNLPINFGVKSFDKGSKVIISSSQIKGNNPLILSGYGKFENDFVVGTKEANKNNNLRDLYEGIGNFSFLLKKENRITIGKDFFSMGRIFYYTDETYTVIANEYHLLLVLMSILDIKMNIDEEVAIANFAYFKGLIYEQHLSRKMDVKGIEQLPIDKYILIENNELKLIDTSMVNMLEEEFNINSYEKLLKEAAQDIEDNINIVYNLDRFKNVIVDITGGMDSRIVYSCITSIKDTKNKIKLYTFDDKRTNDIKVAIPLSNLYNYPFETVPVKIELDELEKEEEITRSLNMGVYFYRDFYKGRKYSKNTIRLLGGGGEAIARPYYTRYLQNDELTNIHDELSFTTELFSRKPECSLLPNENGIEDCIKVFAKELSNTLGDNPFKKYENTYAFLRCGPHFSHKGIITKGFLEWNPIFSKKLFYLKMKTFSIFKNSKLAFDLIKYFNPNLVGLPYEKDINNEEYSTIKDILIKNENETKNENINWSTDTSKWEKANIQKKKVTTYLKNEKVEANRDYYYNGIITAFKYVMNNCSESLKQALGLPIYHWIKNNKDSENDLKTIFNKMNSLADQIRIINNRKKW